jgi:FKBP-type peptidyl-prolyl cis-trans isomerase
MTTNTTLVLRIEDLIAGAGQQATGPGQFVTVHYTGWLENGSEFDSSRQRKPFSFPLSVWVLLFPAGTRDWSACVSVANAG